MKSWLIARNLRKLNFPFFFLIQIFYLSRSPERRVVRKEGLTNVSFKNISKKRRHYFSDLYTTLLDSSWTYCIIMLTISFYGSWLLFGQSKME